MTRQGRPSGASLTGAEQRSLISQAWRLLVDPWLDQVYYWLDLRKAPTPSAPRGHPDHNKVLSSIAFFFGLVGLAVFGREVIATCAGVLRLIMVAMKGAVTIDSNALAALVKACALMIAALLAYAALVFGMAFSLSGFRTWAKTKGGGTTEALGQVGTAAVQTSAEITARRAQGGNEFEATP